MKTINALVKELCKREGLKSQTSIGNVREVIGHLADIIHEEEYDGDEYSEPSETAILLFDLGKRRAKRKKKV
jgi:hypothetical protein